ncbi:MAG: acylphosphatase, partial [Coriobacteriales bacterium]|nr:acylphosphatase [Coriobacteriales bacterium]
MPHAYDLHITGLVQGVGFRPFIYRLARQHGLNGWVLNASDGVHVHVEGRGSDFQSFLEQIELEAPPASDIQEIYLQPGDSRSCSDFEIRSSDALSAALTRVSPDLATCSDCRRELFDSQDRRFAYPFINCTNCGPRFTIIDALPYDRQNTSMAAFEMCGPCQQEYGDPADRR